MPQREPEPNRATTRLPTASKLAEPILQTLEALGGRASNTELDEGVADRLGLSAEDRAVPHDPSKGGRTEFAYRMAWARSRLKADGRIRKEGARNWAIAASTADGQ